MNVIVKLVLCKHTLKMAKTKRLRTNSKAL